MDCLLHLTATLCLIQPSQLTIRADVSTQLSGDFRYTDSGHDYHGAHVGRVQVDLPLLTYRGLRIVGGYEHTSLIDTPHDRGQERMYVGLTYRVFGGSL